jgi:hypothetical protein
VGKRRGGLGWFNQCLKEHAANAKSTNLAALKFEIPYLIEFTIFQCNSPEFHQYKSIHIAEIIQN